ncbi:TonB-dependent receptor [Pseudoxanthomonas broegbernensis]|uniref:TonB-dependent receptor n=2 Tax=Pseudoxanthomonas broegbernensis TaxID=83619 RepID=A0A7V8GPU3_9GAMM|nr:TonB-dependent receptor [Pseudoxanthomonas broegbernensis]
MRAAGQNNLGEVARSLPQSFAGGQNPGVVDPEQNNGGGSSFNLRGLGSDATLTLLNGRRLAYNGANQAVDVSSIPLAAVDRVEVVADGASALYGSDAVGGVANIILLRDFDGLHTTARLGTATDGGFTQQQYSGVAGTTWNSGGVLLALDFSRNTAVDAADRDFTSALDGDQTLYPRNVQRTALASAHHQVSPLIGVSIDAILNDRDTRTASAFSVASPPTFFGAIAEAETRSFVVSPQLDISLSDAWDLNVSGTYAGDKRQGNDRAFNNGGLRDTALAMYDNTTKVLEVSATGSLGRLNGNLIRVALGGGYRSAHLDQSLDVVTATTTTSLSEFSNSRDSYYGFGELEIPVILPANDSIVSRLTITGALRYEDYGRGDDLATPKVGVIVGISDAIEIKGSWGRSFKAPTLYEQFRIPSAYVYPANFFGVTTPGATVIMLGGGNSDLTTENATTWSVSADARPALLNGGKIGASYYNIRYKDRVVSPVTSLVTVFTTPGLQQIVTYNPTTQEIADAASIAPLGLQLGIPLSYDPAAVFAIVDSRYLNAARQDIEGVDVFVDHLIETERVGQFTLSLIGTYLESTQTFLPGAEPIDRAGTVFNPPHWRIRGGVTWSQDGAAANATVNYMSSLRDSRFQPEDLLDPLTTVDLTARYAFPNEGGILGGLELAVSALNVFNTRPRVMRTTSATAVPYDLANHSALGRVVNFTLGKSW